MDCLEALQSPIGKDAAMTSQGAKNPPQPNPIRESNTSKSVLQVAEKFMPNVIVRESFFLNHYQP